MAAQVYIRRVANTPQHFEDVPVDLTHALGVYFVLPEGRLVEVDFDLENPERLTVRVAGNGNLAVYPVGSNMIYVAVDLPKPSVHD